MTTLYSERELQGFSNVHELMRKVDYPRIPADTDRVACRIYIPWY